MLNVQREYTSLEQEKKQKNINIDLYEDFICLKY